MIVVSLFIQSLSWWLSQYIIHCLQCQYYQIVWHQSYEILQSVVELLISFHTVMTDFIVELLKTKNKFDAVMTVICKFLKKIEFISDKETWIAAQWAKTYFAVTIDWNIFLIWIDDRNFKWLSEFWTQLFNDMSTRISTTAAYHAQSDNQLKQINQTMKITLYFAQERNSDTEFIKFLSAFK